MPKSSASPHGRNATTWSQYNYDFFTMSTNGRIFQTTVAIGNFEHQDPRIVDFPIHTQRATKLVFIRTQAWHLGVPLIGRMGVLVRPLDFVYRPAEGAGALGWAVNEARQSRRTRTSVVQTTLPASPLWIPAMHLAADPRVAFN